MPTLSEFLTQYLVAAGAFAAWITFKRSRLAGRTRTTGTILGLRRTLGPNSTLAPIFSFRLIDGTEIIHRSSAGSSPCPFKVGQQVEVLYDPANPQRATIDRTTQIWTAEIVVGVILAMWFVVGLLIVRGVIQLPNEP